MQQKILLFFFLLLSTVTASAQTLIDGIYYVLNTNTKQATVTSGDNKYIGQIVIPETIGHEDVTYNVTSIGSRAFKDCSNMTSVTIPNTVSYIGQETFSGCTGLTSVTIPSGVTSIDNQAFSGCSSLTDIEILGSVKTIYYETFYNCSELTSITIPNSVTSIEKSAFAGCSSLTSVTIPGNVTSIGQQAFFECSNLTSVTIPNSVTSIGRYAFYRTAWYDNQPDGLVYAGNVAYAYKGAMPQNTSIYIKEGTPSITEYAFNNCSGLTSVIIPNSVKSIGKLAFAECSDLIDVYCYARKGPTAGYGIFDNSGIQFAMLHVPEISINGYKTTEPWSGFGNIVALQDSDPKPDSEPESEPIPEYIRGDVNGDGEIGMPDVMYLIQHILNGKFPDEEDSDSKPEVRFGFYETIPGYSVKIDKVNMDGASPYVMGSNVVGTTLGTTITQLTWDMANGRYSFVDFANSNDMFVRIDYTLTSEDGSGETIAVKDAIVTIPSQYIQWMPNYKYTYIIKIYDNSNAYNWGEIPVFNIFPASLDAIVIEDDNGHQTITTISSTR